MGWLVGWVAGWLEQLGIKLISTQVVVEVEVGVEFGKMLPVLLKLFNILFKFNPTRPYMNNKLSICILFLGTGAIKLLSSK